MKNPYQFAFHDKVSKTPPTGYVMTNYFDRLKAGETLTRIEKNELFHELQSNSGKENYMIMGVEVSF